MSAPTNDRREVLAAVLAEHRIRGRDELGYYLCAHGEWLSPEVWETHLAATTDAALAAQEGERGGAVVAAAVALLHRGMHSCRGGDWWTDDPSYRGVIAQIGLCPTRAALADPAGALAKHDAEVLRAAADDLPDLTWTDRDGVTHSIRATLRERADRIAGDQP